MTADIRLIAGTGEHSCENYGIRNNISVTKRKGRTFRGHDMINGTMNHLK